MFCSKCGKEIRAEAVICVHCGCEIDKGEKKEKKIVKRDDIIINVIAIISFAIHLFPGFILINDRYHVLINELFLGGLLFTIPIMIKGNFKDCLSKYPHVILLCLYALHSLINSFILLT